ncbi:MAG: 4-hydroxy-tetrahydrodipicolinate synthase [Muribaculaceae bacterium]|nr:4-hydroxy-tetrahydrodipicolinate synthase [Muribaculaceae bacterium]
MSLNKSLKGLGVALITPFCADKSIDWEALRQLVRNVSCGQQHADFLVVLGTTAETPTLSASEREEVRRFVVAENNGHLPLVLGLGGNSTAAVVEELGSTDLSGYSAILSVTPYYNKPSQEGLYQHFKAVSEASTLPIILYNVPSRTGVNLKADTTLRLAEDCPNIIGIKEASGITSQAGTILRKRPKGFMVWSGDDVLTLPWMALGADGVISVVGNAFPQEMASLVHNALERNVAPAAEMHHSLAEFMSLIFVDGNPSGVKCAMKELGLIKEILRLPLTPVSDETHKKIANFIKNFRG